MIIHRLWPRGPDDADVAAMIGAGPRATITEPLDPYADDVQAVMHDHALAQIPDALAAREAISGPLPEGLHVPEHFYVGRMDWEPGQSVSIVLLDEVRVYRVQSVNSDGSLTLVDEDANVNPADPVMAEDLRAVALRRPLPPNGDTRPYVRRTRASQGRIVTACLTTEVCGCLGPVWHVSVSTQRPGVLLGGIRETWGSR